MARLARLRAIQDQYQPPADEASRRSADVEAGFEVPGRMLNPHIYLQVRLHPKVEPLTFMKLCPAVSYSPTPSRVQYHRRSGS